MKKGKRIFIPPHWVSLLIGIALTAYGLYVLYLVEVKERPISPNSSEEPFIVALGVLMLTCASFCYSIHKRGIMVWILFIPVWFIRWENISSAEYVHTWCVLSDGSMKIKGCSICVTLNNSPLYCPDVESAIGFKMRHPFAFHFIRVRKRNRDRVIQLFQEYYPELAFQLGSKPEDSSVC